MVSVPLALIAGRADGSERSDLRHQAFGAAGGNNYGSFLAWTLRPSSLTLQFVYEV